MPHALSIWPNTQIRSSCKFYSKEEGLITNYTWKSISFQGYKVAGSVKENLRNLRNFESYVRKYRTSGCRSTEMEVDGRLGTVLVLNDGKAAPESIRCGCAELQKARHYGRVTRIRILNRDRVR